MQGIENELEELRQLEEEIKKSKRFEKLEIPALILAILLLYFLIISLTTGQPMV
jgi:cell division protein FtsL